MSLLWYYFHKEKGLSLKWKKCQKVFLILGVAHVYTLAENIITNLE